MKRLLFSFLLIFSFICSFACSCSPPSIKASYLGSEIIFIGKYIGTSEIGGSIGLPLTIENFEVLYFAKGPDMKRVQQALKYRHREKAIVSLLSTKEYGCGVSFDDGKYYIVYATRDIPYGLLRADACLHTHQIPKEQLQEYLTDNSRVPEILALKELVQTDTTRGVGFIETRDDYVPRAMFHEVQENLKNEIIKRQILLALSIPTILILLLLLIFRRRKA